MALHPDALAPIVSLERTVESETDVLDARNRGEFALQLFAEPADSFEIVSGSDRIDVDDIAIGSGDAEVLALEITQGLGHQSCTHQEHERERRLHDDQSLLRQH